ncbi:phospholipase A2 inhibitor and Ly6/PLAUR domain-containing protein-like [Engystomops pustulosus]|uniref:phospholipase A2 inhibitor and Ly6/PLAUR domain-containing protein-like n=1 Tax=Engystomops pustulosus TaxID=76066 RepID=UPI003AFB3195
MRTFLAIIFIISATVKAGECLVCIECKNSTNPDCAGNEVTCGTCMTTVAEIDPRNGSSKSLSVEKTCNLNPEICNITYSISGSKSRVRYTVKCCNTDLCNKEAPEVSPWNVTSTGLQCPACYEPNAETCVANTPVQCTGDENRCLVFSGKFPQSGKCETIAFQGCASELVCNNFGYLYPDNALCPRGSLNCTTQTSSSYVS